MKKWLARWIGSKSWHRIWALGDTREERERRRAFDEIFSAVCAGVGGAVCLGLLCLPVFWQAMNLPERILGLAGIVAGASLLCAWPCWSRFLRQNRGPFELRISPCHLRLRCYFFNPL